MNSNPDPAAGSASKPTPQAASPAKKRSYRKPRIFFFSLVGVALVFLLSFLLYVSFDLPPMQLIENPESDLSTQLVSADGVVLQKYYSRENRVNLRLNDISPHVVNALIATEDARFFSHSGIDAKSFFSIIFGYLTSGEVRGGSTITMQLSRNLYKEVGDESTLIRKPKEFLVSAYIERRFTKQEIMEAYLNTVNIYGNSYGIETTANRLFDKQAKDLTLEESALIVGMLKGQGVYNPFRHPERATARRNTILDQMLKYEFIDTTVVDLDSVKAIALEGSLADQEQVHIRGSAPYYREYVREWLNDWCEEHGYDLYTDGLRVYTSLDSRMQRHAENAVREWMQQLQADFDQAENRGARLMDRDPSILLDLKRQSERYRLAKKAGKTESEIELAFRTKVAMTIFSYQGSIDTVMTPLDSLRYYARILETGLVSIDPTNGHIKAWVGGIDYKYFKYDHVIKSKRQVGSTFKPFVYGAAVEAGYTPCDIMLNQPVTFDNVGGGRWTPKNSDGSIGGKMTLKAGLANSVNLITARLMKQVGPEAVADFAYRMGIKTELDAVPSLALGTTDLTVLELSNAYSTFANKGNHIEPIGIIRIEDKAGNILADFAPQPQKVLSDEHAFLIVELLKGVVNQGTGQRLRFRYKFDNEIGGKTGTTQNQSDGWFMGITPNLVTGVWVGHADRRMHFRSIKYGQGANMALPIWALYMRGVYEDQSIGLPGEPFERPAGLNINLACKEVAGRPTGQNDDGVPTADDFDEFQ